jgi:hypothetical protein
LARRGVKPCHLYLCEWPPPAGEVAIERRRERADFRRHLERAGLSTLEALSARDLGEPVVDHRTSWVRQADLGSYRFFIKTYDYPTLADRLRGAFRTTMFRPSRAAREWDALCWLRSRGLPAPQPLYLLERWHLWQLHRAVLVTEAYPGTRLDRLLPALPPAERGQLLLTLERCVEAMHRAGFRDRNLDLRNLLARRLAPDEWEVAKIDSPRHRIVAPGPACDRDARADWDRLARSLAELQLPR